MAEELSVAISEMLPMSLNQGREIFRVTADRKVIVADDIYEAAMEFWELVQQMRPEGWTVEKG